MQHGGGIMIAHLDRRLLSVLVAFTCTCYGPGWVLAQDVRQIDRASTPSTVRLVEVLAIGALEGDADQFGRIMDVAVDGRGHLLIADDLSSQVKVFGPDGTHIASMGRPGQGPGEFVSPWAVAVDAHDSVYVWDAESGRVSVFSPGYAFVRSFRVSPSWLITSMLVIEPGEVVLAAFGSGDQHPIKILDTKGNLLREAGAKIDVPNLAGFEGSLLGGYLTRLGDGFAYTQKSPYAITIFDARFRERVVCEGPSNWTTDPAEVVAESARGVSLQWNRYVHSASILSLSSGGMMNVVLDPVAEKRTIQLISHECEMHAEMELLVPVTPRSQRDGRIVAVRSLNYPEVVVYRLEMDGGF